MSSEDIRTTIIAGLLILGAAAGLITAIICDLLSTKYRFEIYNVEDDDDDDDLIEDDPRCVVTKGGR